MGLGFELEDFNGFRVSGFRMNSGADGCMLPMLCIALFGFAEVCHIKFQVTWRVLGACNCWG